MKKILLVVVAMLATLGLHAQDAASVKVLLDADFTKVTEGSEESPKTLLSYQLSGIVDGISSISGVSAAGGKILVSESSSSSLTLKSFGASAGLPTAGGTVRITARVKMKDYSGGFQYQPGYSSSDYVTEYIMEDKVNEWVDVVSYVGNVKSSSSIKMVPFLSVAGFYLESLKVEYSEAFIASPVAYLPSDYDGTQFKAECSAVSGATKFSADVFSLDADGNRTYFVQGAELKKLTAFSTSASATITGLDPEKEYYYVAFAETATAKSEESNMVKLIKKVESVAAPNALAATNISDNGFTANWEAVEGAVGYMVNVYSKTILAETQNLAVFNEDFSGITFGSPSSLDFGSGKDLNDYTSSKGWITDSSKTFAAGYYVIYPFSGPGVLITPAMDLSQCDGKFQFILKGATRDFSSFTASDDTVTVEILDADDNVLESVVKTMDQADIADYTFDFTKGAQNCRLSITFTQAEGSSMKLFIDEVTVMQELPAGSVVERQISSNSTEQTSYKVEMTLEEGIDYYYAVIALAETVIGSGSSAYVGEIESPESEKILVKLVPSAVEEVGVSTAGAWKSAAGELTVTGRNIVVADLGGVVLLRSNSEDAQTFTVNHNGVVVVLVDGKNYKFAL